MSSVRKSPARTEWLDEAALHGSRRYARLASLALTAAMLVPFVTLRQQPVLRLPPVQPLVLALRFQEVEPEPVRPPQEERRLFADESPHVAPDVEQKREMPPPEPPRSVEPEKRETPPPKPKPGPKPKPRAERRAPVAPPDAPAAVQEAPAQPGTDASPRPAPVRAEVSDASRQQALRVLVEEIERRKRYPRQARRTGAEGVVTLLIRVGSDGRVRDCSVGKGSGIGVLDLETARLGEKLAGLDTGVRGAAFSVRVPVKYELK